MDYLCRPVMLGAKITQKEMRAMGRQRKDEREVIHEILTNIDNPSKEEKNDNSVGEDRTVYMVSNTFHHRGIYYEPLEPPPDDLNNRELLRLWRRGYLDRIE